MILGEDQKQKLLQVLPKYITAERFFGLCELATRSRALQKCSPGSLVNCFISAAQLGLEPNTPLGHAYIIPFANKHTGQTHGQLIVGWRGLVDLAVRSGAATKIVANLVRAGDVFKFRPVDAHAPIVHEPNLDADDEDTDSIIGAYAVAFLKDGTQQAEYMSRKQIDRIRARSKASNDGPWVTDFSEMARKCPTRRLMKYLQLSGSGEETERFGQALNLDNEMFGEETADTDEPPMQIAAPQNGAAQPEKRRPGRPKAAPTAGAQQQPSPDVNNVAAANNAAPAQDEQRRAPQTYLPLSLSGKPVVAPSAPQELCGYCHQPGHTWSSCPKQEADRPEPEQETVIPETAIQEDIPPTAPAAEATAPASAPVADREISASEYDDLTNDARKLHPNRTMTWVSDILQDNFGLNDLGDLKVSQIAKFAELMQTRK